MRMNQNHHVLVRTSACIISLGERGEEFVDVCVCVCVEGGRGVVVCVHMCVCVCVCVSEGASMTPSSHQNLREELL